VAFAFARLWTHQRGRTPSFERLERLIYHEKKKRNQPYEPVSLGSPWFPKSWHLTWHEAVWSIVDTFFSLVPVVASYQDWAENDTIAWDVEDFERYIRDKIDDVASQMSDFPDINWEEVRVNLRVELVHFEEATKTDERALEPTVIDPSSGDAFESKSAEVPALMPTGWWTDRLTYLERRMKAWLSGVHVCFSLKVEKEGPVFVSEDGVPTSVLWPSWEGDETRYADEVSAFPYGTPIAFVRTSVPCCEFTHGELCIDLGSDEIPFVASCRLIEFSKCKEFPCPSSFSKEKFEGSGIDTWFQWYCLETSLPNGSRSFFAEEFRKFGSVAWTTWYYWKRREDAESYPYLGFETIDGFGKEALDACSLAPNRVLDSLGNLDMLGSWPTVLLYLSTERVDKLLRASCSGKFHHESHDDPLPLGDVDGGCASNAARASKSQFEERRAFYEATDSVIHINRDLALSTTLVFNTFRRITGAREIPVVPSTMRADEGKTLDVTPEAGDDLSTGDPNGQEKPHWDGEACELRFKGRLAKELRPIADSQISVLAAFEEAEWPQRIDNPLPTDDKQRMRETIRHLNERCEGLRFRADGTGKGIVWEPE
jgi:hypothetical protein